MRAASDDNGLPRVVIVLAVLTMLPGLFGLGVWLIMPNGTDTALLLGLIGSLVAPSFYVLACGLGSLITGWFRT